MHATTGLEPLISQLSIQPCHTLPTPASTDAAATLQQNVDRFLAATDAQLNIRTIYTFLGALIQRVELVGHEMYKLFDPAVFDEALQAQDVARRDEFLHAYSQPITSCTVRFHLRPSQHNLYTLICELQKKLFPTATTPFFPHNMLTGFALQGAARVHYVFCIDLARHYFATIDAVRLDITSGRVNPIDDGMFTTWVEDSVSKTIRIPQPESCSGSKHLCSLIAEGYRPTPEAYTLLHKEYPLHTLIEKLVKDYEDKDEATSFFTLMLGQASSVSRPSGTKICSQLLLLAHENHLSFSQLQAFLCILGPALTAHATCTKEGVSYRFSIDRHLLVHRIAYVPNKTEELFSSIPAHVFTSPAFIQLCALLTGHASPVSPLADDKNHLRALFLASFSHAMGKASTAEILHCFSSCYFPLASPIRQILVRILQHTLQVPFEPNGAKDEDEFIEELLTVLIPHTNPHISSWGKQKLVQLPNHAAFKEKYISTQDVPTALRLIEQLQETVSAELVATCCQQEFILKQLVLTCPNLCRRLYSVLDTEKKCQLIQSYVQTHKTLPDDIVGDCITLILTELQLKTATRSHVEWLCTLPSNVKPFERIQILMHSCLQFPDCSLNKEHIQALAGQLQPTDREQLSSLYKEIEQKKRTHAALFSSCVPVVTPGAQLSQLLAKKPTQKQKAEWQRNILKQLGQGVSAKSWEKTFEKCSEWLEYDLISAMILLAFRNRDQFKSAADALLVILQHPDWLREEHMAMLKEAPYFIGLFAREPSAPHTFCVKLLRHVKVDPKRLQEYAGACVQWFQAIDAKHPQKNSVGLELFLLLCQDHSEQVTRQTHILVHALKPYFLTFQSKQTAKNSASKNHNQMRLNILDSLIQHVKAVKTKISKNSAADMLVELIPLLHAYEDSQTDDVLLTSLSDFAHPKVVDALFATWSRILLRPLLASDIYPCAQALIGRIVKEASLDTLQGLFAFYFLRDGLPSQQAIYDGLRSETDAPPEVQTLYRTIAPGYKRMLQETLRSENIAHAKQALDIAFAIVFSPIKPAPLLLVQPIQHHFETIVTLFVRVYAHAGWTDPVNLLFEHLLSYAVDDKMQTPPKEQIDLTSMPLCHMGFYQYWILDKESNTTQELDTTVARSYILSNTGPTEAEKAFISFLRLLITEALHYANRLVTTTPRARLLDLAVQHIRTLIETYPSAPGIDEMIQLLKSCVTSADHDLFQAHTWIIDLIEKMRTPSKRTQVMHFIPNALETINQHLKSPDTCTQQAILALQHTLFNWTQQHTISSFDTLLSCVRALLDLITAKKLLNNTPIHDMMYTLLIPHLKCSGSGYGEAGQMYALTACGAYCNQLSKSHPFVAIDFAIDAYLSGAFDGHYDGFALHAHTIVLASLVRIPECEQPKEVLSRLATLVSLPVKTEPDRRKKNELIAKLVQINDLPNEHRLEIIKGLIEHRAPRDFKDDDIALALLILCFLKIQDKDPCNALLMRFVSQTKDLQLTDPSRCTVRIG